VVALNSTPVAPAQTQAGDSVTGSAELFGGPFGRGSTFALDAHSGPSGENPNGTATVTSAPSPGTVTGPVTCLNVTAHRATIGIFAQGAADVFFFVEDNDGVGQDTVGWGFFFSSSPPTVCPATSTSLPIVLVVPPRPIDSGNIQVTDAPPFPTSKDQCNKGGWQQFGLKNQGQCVAFVERGPKG
jgi:hypothetical protein